MAPSAARCHGGCVSRSGQCVLVPRPEQRGGFIERGDVIDGRCLVAGHLAGDRAWYSRPDHVVVVVMENHSAADISGNGEAPYINALAARGALFTRSFAVAHPSEPNYLALFSGSTQGVTSDACPLTLTGTNLAAELAQAGGTSAGYSEGLPAVGDPVCSSGTYARKHAPWVNFPSLPATVHQPFTAFPSDFAALPTVSFVIPDLDHDMHDGSVATGDTWLAEQLRPYATWAEGHNSMLVLTFDEDDRSRDNQITTIIVGAHVRAGRYDEHLDHYRLLATLKALAGLGNSEPGALQPITDAWTR